ncbi:MAG: heat-inducible transcriptional repressor HrcA [Deltaproteobacteria bacterium]|jgi:heat-inducible transcriptional repressor|nr:heat-inducible transcriptional repressor HrcA [Deltaproteobacteria bacterium]
MDQFQNHRQRLIFEAVVRDYIRTGQPVGSRNLAVLYRLNLSPASVRKVMGELEGLGLLSQAHASAGRAPTERGFKVYVDHILKVDKIDVIHPGIREAIDRALSGPDAETGPHFKFFARLLTDLTNGVGLVMAPKDCHLRLKKIHFFRLSRAQVLTVLVSENGVIQNKLLSPAEDYSQDELNQVNVYLEGFAPPFTLAGIKEKIIEAMGVEKNRFEEIFRRVLTLASQTQAAVEDPPGADGDFYIDDEGQGRLLENPDFKDAEALRSLFWAFANKKRLIELLNEVTGEDRVRVVIGPSGREEDGLALVASPYYGGPGGSGALGILGPRRLNYSEIVPMVDYAAQAVGSLFSK